MTSAMRDLHQSWRVLCRSPGFTAVTILTLAFGIGVNVAMFSVMNGILLRPLPYQDPERIVRLWESNPTTGHTRFEVLPGSYLDWRERSKTLEAVALYYQDDRLVTGGGQPQRLNVAVVSPSLFEILGVAPILGRGTPPAEPRQDDVEWPEIVLSHRAWRQRFGGDPSVLGMTLRFEGFASVAVVGVMPPGFEFPKGADGWMARVLTREMGRGDRFRHAIGKLRPGVSIEQARAELRAIARQAEIGHPATNAGWTVDIERLADATVGHVRWAVIVLFGAVVCLLLIACANVASAWLARAAGRRHELAIRAALGATRGRLVRLSLTEGLLVTAVACALGVLLADFLLAFLISRAPAEIPRLDEVVIDRRVVAFAVGLSALTALAVGLAPWIRFNRRSGASDLTAGRTLSITPGRAYLGAMLVVTEIALTLVLLAGAGLLIRSFVFLRNLDLGFEPRGVWTTELAVPLAEFAPPGGMRIGARPEWERLGVFYRSLVDQVRRMPGIEAAATVSEPPLAGQTPSFFQHGRTGSRERDAERWPAVIQKITPEYFRVLRTPIRRGRMFTEQDALPPGHLFAEPRAPGVALVNEAMARRFWPGRDPIGQEIAIDGDWPVSYRTIVGVVGDVRRSPANPEPEPLLYLPRAQSRPDFSESLFVRVRSDAPGAAEAVAPHLRAAHSALSAPPFVPLDVLYSESLAEQRFSMLLASTFGILALLLAAVGLYGVVAFVVSHRTREIGVRIALGARRDDIIALVLRQAAQPVVVGVLLGSLGALATGRIVAALVVGVDALDPLVLVGTGLLIALVALLAVIAPARAAAGVDPIRVLRHE